MKFRTILEGTAVTLLVSFVLYGQNSVRQPRGIMGYSRSGERLAYAGGVGRYGPSEQRAPYGYLPGHEPPFTRETLVGLQTAN